MELEASPPPSPGRAARLLAWVWSTDLRFERRGVQSALLWLTSLAAFGLSTYIAARVFHASDDLRIFYPLSGSLAEVGKDAPGLAGPLATMMLLWVWQLPLLALVDIVFYRRILGRPFPLETLITQVAAQGLYLWVWPRFTLARFVDAGVSATLAGAGRLLEHVPTLVHLHGFLALLMAALLADLTYYWGHRMGHSVRLFWNLGHIGHHRGRDVTSFAAGAEPASRLLNIVGPVNVVRLLAAMVLAKLFTTDLRGAAWGVVVMLALEFWVDRAHSPPLWWLESRSRVMRAARLLIMTPGLHALHHSRAAEHNLADGCNFAARFTLWDRLFGTYCEPSAAEPIPELGLFDPEADYCVGSPLRYVVRPYVRMLLELRRNHVRHWPAIFFGHAGWEPPVPSGMSH